MAKSKLTLVSGTLLETKLSLYVTELPFVMTLFSVGGKMPLVYLHYDDRGSLQFSFFSFISKLFQFRYFLFDWINSVNRSFGYFNKIRSALHKIYQIVEEMSKSLLKLHEKNCLWKKRKSCRIPLHIAAHSSSNQKRKGKLKADRHFSLQQVEDISRKFVTVLPVSTGM